MAGVFCTLLYRDDQFALLLAIDGWNAHLATARNLLGLGISISLTYSSEAGLISRVVVIVVYRGFRPCHDWPRFSVVTRLTHIAFQLNTGLLHASFILVSRILGQGNRRRVH
ncbi:hypothetical protein MUBE_10010 [Mycobacterium uberis]|uniref:Uncharacterized protein n=1 Tax=Mycobacterium uberis TaxID=2162698 RepID=A0A3E1HG39_9MYCO|nr:hypothetical protein MUBE_10010 [Mycobacterium uberis]